MRSCNLLVAALLVLSTTAVLGQGVGAPAPDVGAGKRRAAVCFACHGEEGISRVPGTPHLAGQERTYLENALHAYRDGQTRQNPIMNAMAKPLSDADITNIAAYFSLQTRMNSGQTAAQAAELIERVRAPVTIAIASGALPGTTAAAATTGHEVTSASATSPRSGESIYQSTCFACHGSGAAGAPKVGDKVAWSPRIARGTDTLLQHALQGFNAMPPRGTCVTCSDSEIASAVNYLISKAR